MSTHARNYTLRYRMTTQTVAEDVPQPGAGPVAAQAQASVARSVSPAMA
ncbi:TPA: hypothetical protein HH295_21400 [Xanthomonas vasicola pv. zeae]|nr:hypothetical protein [Xanthomonas vasicola]HHZ25008.1 hypothetical protein [Xanthomonas vasicola pv. zeae]HHZ33082.1 hypothetical protein [Xanthomonas vasicola pv. zeae]HHZ36989.1 hypothetical protein [Xanthomonas vasicola pv. zeae]HHZ40956.1 hypothetical protein [Xanthomonas vasicola pv. zeae]HHZ44914.1 hypothetical protein [Xanthomonas vasicola pv. zeae]